jgi:hypothetical protein
MDPATIAITALVAIGSAGAAIGSIIWYVRGWGDRIESKAELQHASIMGETKLQTVKIDHIAESLVRVEVAAKSHEARDEERFGRFDSKLDEGLKNERHGRSQLAQTVAAHESEIEHLQRAEDHRQRGGRSYTPGPFPPPRDPRDPRKE